MATPALSPPEAAESLTLLIAAMKSAKIDAATVSARRQRWTREHENYVVELRAARELMGHDFWSYGLHANRKVLEIFLRHHHAQGLSSRLVSPEELFHPSTHESFAI